VPASSTTSRKENREIAPSSPTTHGLSSPDTSATSSVPETSATNDHSTEAEAEASTPSSTALKQGKPSEPTEDDLVVLLEKRSAYHYISSDPNSASSLLSSGITFASVPRLVELLSHPQSLLQEAFLDAHIARVAFKGIQKDLERSENQLREARAQRDELQAQCDNMKEAKNAVEKDFERSESQLREAEVQRSDLQTSVDDLTKDNPSELYIIRFKNKQLEHLLKGKNKVLEEKDVELISFQTSLKDKDNKIKSMSEEVKEKDEVIETLRRDLASKS
jgi:hypothetical protein